MEPKNPIIINGVEFYKQTDINRGLDEEHYVTEFHLLATHYNLLLEDYARKTQECQRLKDELSTYGATGICETCTDKSVLQNDKYARTLRELKKIAERQVPYINLDQVKTCMEVEFDYAGAVWYLQQRMRDILQIIADSEVKNE